MVKLARLKVLLTKVPLISKIVWAILLGGAVIELIATLVFHHSVVVEFMQTYFSRLYFILLAPVLFPLAPCFDRWCDNRWWFGLLFFFELTFFMPAFWAMVVGVIWSGLRWLLIKTKVLFVWQRF